jgi:hypothetical protein
MTILWTIVAGMFVLMSVGIFVRYATVRRSGLLLGAITYAVAGIGALLLGAWWPLAAGVTVAWILGRAGADPPTDLRLDLPTIERPDVGDSRRIHQYLSWWITEDSQVSLVSSQFVREAWEHGWRRPASVPADEAWSAATPTEAWLAATESDMRSLAAVSKERFLAHLDGIDALGAITLMAAGDITVECELPAVPPNLASVRTCIHDDAQLRVYVENYVADALLSARLRVLAWTYQYWHGERYEMVEKRMRS